MTEQYDIKELIKNPEHYASNISIDLLVKLVKIAIKHYELNEPIINDYTYDIIYDILKERDGNNILFKQIGYKDINDKTKLPFYMGSMTKIKDKTKIQTWMTKYKGPNYIVSSKLDGASALLEYKNSTLQLYSRGNGIYGRNLSHLIKYMDIPKFNTTQIEFCIRGELVISKQNFNKYSDKYSNSRSLINGIMNKKDTKIEDMDKEILKEIDLIIFDLIYINDKYDFKPEKQLELSKQLGFKVCEHEIITQSQLNNFGKENKIDNSFILNMLLKYKLNTKYDIDGLIITDNNIHERNKDGNPNYSFAFKSNGIGKVTKVKNVEWNISKHGYIIPRVSIDPILIDGINIKYATGFNAKFIVDNNIGLNSEVRIVRSGDVIPFIIEVISKAQKPIMPSVNYYWNETLVNILIDDKNCDILKYKKIVTFFQTLGFENISGGILKRLITAGYDSIKKILLIKKDNIIAIDGFKETLTNKLFNNIHKIIDNPIPLSKLMTASLCFGHGFGEKKIEVILDKYPNIVDSDCCNISYEMIEMLNGYSSKTAIKFIDNLPSFKLFLKELDFIKILKVKKKKFKIIGGKFDKKNIVLTGFRDEAIISFIIKHNGTVSNVVNKKTYLLISKDEDYYNSKLDTAQLLGIDITTKDKFVSKYNIN